MSARPRFGLMLGAIVVAAPTASVLAQTYTVQEIPSFGNDSWGIRMNTQGIVAGQSRDATNTPQSFLWHTGSMTMLPVLPGHVDGAAVDINDLMETCGISEVAGERLAYLYRDGVIENIHTLASRPNSDAWGINNNGLVVGDAFFDGFTDRRAWVWTEKTGMIDITPDGVPQAWAVRINENDVVVGNFGEGIGVSMKPAVWEQVDGVWQVAFDLSGVLSSTRGRANGLNDSDPVGVTGHFRVGDGPRRGFAWNEKTPDTFVEIGPLVGYFDNRGTAINNEGVVVGWSFNGTQFGLNSRAWIWQNGQTRVLNDLLPAGSGWDLREAQDIDDAGRITGRGFNGDGDLRGYVLTPCHAAINDCNGNNVEDGCDLDLGTSTDCNGNGVPDECDDTPRTHTVVSAALSPFHDDSPQSFTITLLPPATGDVTIDFEASADLNLEPEDVAVRLNGDFIGWIFDHEANDCPEEPDQDQLIVSAETFNEAVNNGTALFAMDPFVAVGPCAGSFISISLSYPIGSHDCNGNGAPDECDLEDGTSVDANGDGVPDECDCPADTDGSGSVDADDLVNVILDWASDGSGHGGDVDGSGLVDADDLIAVILAWGPCVV